MADYTKLLEGAFKIVLSKGDDAFRKIVINKKSGKTGDFFQAEKYTDKQVFHKNISMEELEAYVAALSPGAFKQADAFSEGRCRTLRVSKKGKESLSESKNEQAKKAESHNRTKNYLLPEGTVIPPRCRQDAGQIPPDQPLYRDGRRCRPPAWP